MWDKYHEASASFLCCCFLLYFLYISLLLLSRVYLWRLLQNGNHHHYNAFYASPPARELFFHSKTHHTHLPCHSITKAKHKAKAPFHGPGQSRCISPAHTSRITSLLRLRLLLQLYRKRRHTPLLPPSLPNPPLLPHNLRLQLPIRPRRLHNPPPRHARIAKPTLQSLEPSHARHPQRDVL